MCCVDDDGPSIFQILRCVIFHRRYHKRTGERYIGRVSITYEMRCEKCGMDGLADTWWADRLP